MLGKFSDEAKKILVNTRSEMVSLKHPYIGTEHLLLSILGSTNEISDRLNKNGIEYKKVRNEIIKIIGVGTTKSEYFLYTPLLRKVIETAALNKEENEEVKTEDLFAAMIEEGEGIAVRILVSLGVTFENLYDVFVDKVFKDEKPIRKKKPLLDEMGYDLVESARKGNLDPVIGRDKEIKRVIEILSRRTKNNPILIGEAGVGKTAIAEELARMIVNGEVPWQLKNKRIISVDMASLVAGTKYRGEFEERLHKIIKELEGDPDTFLFIDEIHTLVGAGGAEGAIDASNIFKPALARGKLRCIGATTIDEYKKHIEGDSALARRFQNVLIEIPDKKLTKEILMNIKPIYESFHGVKVEEKMIDYVIELSNKYIYDRNEPDASIDILDEVCAHVNLKSDSKSSKVVLINKKLNDMIKKKNEAVIRRDFVSARNFKKEEDLLISEVNKIEVRSLKTNNVKTVTKKDILDVVAFKTNIPIFEISKNNKNMIDNIDSELRRKVIGQDSAINSLIKSMKRIQLGFKEENRCISFLFAGPTGCGKTILAKLFGNLVVGSTNVIKLDMSEFSESHSVSKIIGSPPGYIGYDDNKNILEMIRLKPYSVLILDEIERAHPSILNLFYQALDEGRIKNAKGKNVRMDNVIIIMTTNIGFSNESVGFGDKANDKKQNLKEHYGVEFLNRIENVIEFCKISNLNIEKIIRLELENVIKKFKNRINISIGDKIISDIKKRCEYDIYGARRVNKIISEHIESIIIDEIIENREDIVINSL